MDNFCRKILRLDKKLTEIFDFYQDTQDIQDIQFTQENSFIKPFNIKYKFPFEYQYGFIEYKRTLSTYLNKKDKLLRQILWRMSESILYSNITKPICYYIIGLEDDGKTSNLSKDELEKSLEILQSTISDTKIKKNIVYLFNELNKSLVLVIKLWLEEINGFNYFE